jgi:hypothetical protein
MILMAIRPLRPGEGGKPASQTRPRNLAHLNRDRGYRWTDRDPVLDEITRLITDSGLDIDEIIERVLDASGNSVHLSYSTISNWLSGKTRKPQNFTVTWVATALGYRREFVKI